MSEEVPSVPLSLKARENASRSLKRIFDQINDSVPDQQTSVLNLLPSMDGSDVVNKFPEDCAKEQSQELAAGLNQGTRDFFALHSCGAESYVEEEALSEGSTKALLQRAPNTNVASVQSSKEEPTESKIFGTNVLASLSVENDTCNSQKPRSAGKPRSNQYDHEMPANQAKQRAGLAFPALTQDEANRMPLGCTASPTSSFVAPQVDDFSSNPDSGVNGLLGMAQSSSRPSISSADGRKHPATAQMTIFYSGIVNVYDDVPAEKAHAIVLLAGSGNSRVSYLPNDAKSTAVPSSGAATTTVVMTGVKDAVPVTSGVTASMETSLSTPLPKFPAPVKQVVQRSHAELPFARKVSLARFLERRRDRVQAKATQKTIDSVPVPEAKRMCSRSSSPSPAGTSR